MTGKLTFLAAATAGYVLGARAGRERYESIKSTAGSVWQNPTVRQAASAAQDTVVAGAKKATSSDDV